VTEIHTGRDFRHKRVNTKRLKKLLIKTCRN